MANKRQQIIDAVKDALEGIRKSADYYTDLGLHLFEWRSSPVGLNELPAQILRDRTREPDVELTGNPNNLMHQILELEDEISFAPASDASLIRKGIADVYKALNADRTLGGIALDIIDRGDTMVYADEEAKIIAGAQVKFAVLYRTGKMEES